eukprot:2660689-Pyramimonas_sp.AAC.1
MRRVARCPQRHASIQAGGVPPQPAAESSLDWQRLGAGRHGGAGRRRQGWRHGASRHDGRVPVLDDGARAHR